MDKLPQAIALLTLNHERVGFVLLAVESHDEQSYTGDCVFSMMPENADVIESALGVIISELKIAGEHSCRILVIGKRLELTVTPRGLPQVRMILDPDDQNAIFTLWEGKEQQVGIVGFM